jgi:hypothetical protein
MYTILGGCWYDLRIKVKIKRIALGDYGARVERIYFYITAVGKENT